MRYIIGIDEVGRGSLAGPVVVAAACIPKKLRFQANHLPELRDSKKLSPRQRNIWALHVKNHPRITFATARISPKIIDRINITKAANRAALRAYEKLLSKHASHKHETYLDGGLYLGNRGVVYGAKTIVRGDEKIPAIALASIMAKVSRDRFMQKLAKKYPKYRFEVHKGYGTVMHRASVAKYGVTPIHRLSFLKKQ